MKKALTLVLALCMVFALCACGQQAAPAEAPAPAAEEAPAAAAPAEEAKVITIGISQCTTQEERWRNDANAMQQYADTLGVKLQFVDAANDSATQATQIENLVTSGVDVIVASPCDSDAIAPALEEAKAAGIPVVVWGRQANTAAQDFFLINDFVQTGMRMAEIATSAVQEGKVVIIGGDKSSTVPTDMTNGIMSVLQPYIDDGKMEIAFEQYITNWDPAGAMTAMENALTQLNNDVQLVICHNDGMAGGAIQALEGQALAGSVPVIGMDAEIAALQRIAEGKQFSTAIFDHSTTAKLAIDAAVALANGTGIDDIAVKTTDINGTAIPTAEIPQIMVTLDNMKELIIDTGIHTEAEVYVAQ